MSFGSDLKVRSELGESGTACGRGMRDHLADDENGGTVADLCHEIGQFVERTDETLRVGAIDPTTLQELKDFIDSGGFR
jgi:hypothetical protein